MHFRRQIAKFTLCYFLGLIVAGTANYFLLGSIAPDSIVVEISNLFSFVLAAIFTTTPLNISRSNLTIQSSKSLTITLAVWTFAFPFVCLALVVALSLLVGQIDFAQTVLTRWAHASSLIILGMIAGQAFDALLVYVVVHYSLGLYFNSQPTGGTPIQ